LRDVTGYGATGDGSTDDTAAIQDAIDDLPVTGGAIIFPPGTYLINKSILMNGTSGLRNYVTLTGSGPSTVIKFAASVGDVPCIQIAGPGQTATGMLITNMFFDGNEANQGAGSHQTAIDLSGGIRSQVIACRIYDFYGDGIWVGGSQDCTISDSYFYDCANSGVAQGTRNLIVSGLTIDQARSYENTEHGMHLTHVDGLIVSSSVFRDNTKDGIRFQVGETTNIYRVVLDGVSSYSNTEIGIAFYASSDGTTIQGFTVGGCPIRDNGLTGLKLYADRGVIQSFSISGSTAATNGQSSESHGIELYGRVRCGTVSGNVCWSNNAIAGSTASGIWLEGRGDESDEDWLEAIAITGNCCGDDRASPLQYYGIRFRPTTRNCVAQGNTLYGNVSMNLGNAGINNDVSHNAGW